MKVTSIALFNDQIPDPLILSFRDPSSTNPYQFVAVGGLDAEEIMWAHNGSGYEAKLRKREVVARVGLNPNWGTDETYSTLRDRLFKIIQSTRDGEISLGFRNGDQLVAVLSGRIVKMEASTSTKTPEQMLTIECRNPMLLGPTLVDLNTTGLDPSEFVIHDQVSTAPHGMVMTVKFNAKASSFTVTNDDGSKFQCTPVGTGGFLVDDQLIISSILNAKGVVLRREEANLPVADSIHAKPVWPTIYPRENTFKLSGDVDLEDIKYPTAYWGI